MKSNETLDSILGKVRSVQWLRVGDWEAPVLYEDIYCKALKDWVSMYAKTDFGCREFLHIKPITYISLADYEPFASIIRERIERNPAFLSYLTDNFKQEAVAHETVGTNISKYGPKLGELSETELQAKFEEYLESLLRMTPYSYVFSWGDEYIFGNLIRGILEKYCRECSPGELRDYFLKLTSPPSEPAPMMISYQDALLDLAQLVKEDEKLKHLFRAGIENILYELKRSQAPFYSLVERHIEQYGWLGTRHFKGEPIDAKETIEKVKELLCVDLEKEKSARKKQRRRNEIEFKRVVEELGVKGPDLDIIERIREHVYLKTHRKENMGKVAFQIMPLFTEIAGRLSLTYDEFVELTVDEVRRFLKKGTQPDRDVIRNRQEGYAYIIMGGGIYLVIGDKLKKLTEEISFQFKQEIRGQIANKGRVRGVAKVVLKKKDINKIEKGDIFVTDMTNPNISIAARKCAAIVTDKGGILCHASILSRELGIPCIVGTGNATQLLKDGYEVEVDATKGVVQILEEKKN